MSKQEGLSPANLISGHYPSMPSQQYRETPLILKKKKAN